MKNKKLYPLIVNMLKTGVIGFGGGTALVPVIETQIVERSGIVSEESFNRDVMIASITPGALPVEIAAGIGRETAGNAGMILSAVSMALPGALFTLILLVLFSGIGGAMKSFISLAAVLVSGLIIFLLARYVLGTLKQSAGQRERKICLSVILAVFLLCAENNVNQLLGISRTPVFGVSSVQILAAAFFVILFTKGQLREKKRTLPALAVSLAYFLSVGKAHLLSQRLALPLALLMAALALAGLFRSVREAGDGTNTPESGMQSGGADTPERGTQNGGADTPEHGTQSGTDTPESGMQSDGADTPGHGTKNGGTDTPEPGTQSGAGAAAAVSCSPDPQRPASRRAHSAKRQKKGGFPGKELLRSILLWFLFVLILSFPAILLTTETFSFIGMGFLSSVMSFGGGDAYLSVAQGLFVESGMVSHADFFGNIVTVANALPGSILCKVLTGVGYCLGRGLHGSAAEGVLMALCGFSCSVAASGSTYIAVWAVHQKFENLRIFRTIRRFIRPIVSGLLINVTLSLFLTVICPFFSSLQV